ncbi:hypothetical protein [Prevotella sp.]|uniref:hypothetical protein n=1 Tax=Prevotella sp. TaxID=59823 RepID=UPI001CAD7EBB|nr:hypothetical protein [Prevotella sp.]MBF1628533.1 hypothetical protein [Prevotella sp.]
MGRVVPNEWVELYPAKKYDRIQRMGRSLPNEWVRRYPAAGYKIHEKGIKMMLIY